MIPYPQGSSELIFSGLYFYDFIKDLPLSGIEFRSFVNCEHQSLNQDSEGLSFDWQTFASVVGLRKIILGGKVISLGFCP